MGAALLSSCAAVWLCRPVPPCAPRNHPTFTLSKAKTMWFLFRFLVVPALCQNRRFFPARPPLPLIFPFSFFEFSRSACAAPEGDPAHALGENSKKEKEKILGHKIMALLLLLMLLLPLILLLMLLLLLC